MFLDANKGRGIIIGPSKGKLLYFTDEFKLRRIHAYESKKQTKEPITFKQTKSLNKFLAFTSTGDVVAIIDRKRKNSKCLNLKSIKLEVIPNHELHRSPDSFHLVSHHNYDPPADSQIITE